MRIVRFTGLILLLAAFVVSQSGCAVPQPRGNGTCTRLVEPETQTGYWLYLPEDYVSKNGQHPDSRRWPIVVTLHGLKPYDNANPQARSWQQEADRYGFIVIAPELRTCDSLTMQYPLRDPTLPYVRKDERSILATMDDVCRRTNADPSRALITSFSSGGYLAHFMLNRHPDRFSCLAVLWSNFNEALLNPAQVPKYRHTQIGLFFGQNDFKDCREQSMRAAEWYRRYRFDVEAKKVAGLGHERKPQVAAAFFAKTIGVNPKTPPDIGSLVMQDAIPVADVASGPRRALQHHPIPPSSRRPASLRGPASPGVSRQPTSPLPDPDTLFTPTARRPVPPVRERPVRVRTRSPVSRAPSPVGTAPRRAATPKRPGAQPYAASVTPAPRTGRRGRTTRIPARERIEPPPPPAWIHVHGQRTGHPPMWVSLSVEMPLQLREGASILWTDNNRPISTGTFEARAILRDPGQHIIEARIITADDRRIILRENLKVLPRTSSQPADS